MWKYPDLKSTMQPVLHYKSIPVPILMSLHPVQGSHSVELNEIECSHSNYDKSFLIALNHLLKENLGTSLKNLNSSKQASEVLAKRLKKKNRYHEKT